jgi:hypothetical protein
LKGQDFRYYSFAIDLPTPTNSPEPIVALIQTHFSKVWSKGVIYRTTGTTLFELVSCDVVQRDLFGGLEQDNRLTEVHKQIDVLENKFGKRIVYLGSTHKSLNRPQQGTEADDLDRNLLFL